eukprot:TRINITY_DN13970_c0_g1_i1.p1 TRINITY_DN13970_c0_g1~~TRINITY_DN13970_c0_g1_i1.p1  ORF type:complete len:354 (-),score=83.45 TRINITY_DN13970_c0_g1_i1:306-1367(-)
MPSSGRENLGWNIGHKAIGSGLASRGRTDVVDVVADVARPQIFMDIAIGGAPAGRIVADLYVDAVPRTAENFRSLCTGERGVGKRGKALHYKGCPFHRIIPNFMVQGGDITHFDGSGGESIFGQTFPDENLNLKHTVPGILSMANSGKDTNGSQFFITTKACPHLDGKHVVFGRVVDGMEVLERMEEAGTPSGKVRIPVVVDDCGLLKTKKAAEAEAAAQAAEGPGRGTKRKRASDLPSEVHVYHILKKHSGSKEPKCRRGNEVKCTKSRATLGCTNIRRKLGMNDGSVIQKFIEVAREQSDCVTALKGGELGVVQPGQLPQAVEEVAFSLSVGEVSEPFESPDGIHLMLRAR